MGNYDKTFNTICRVCLKHEKLENMSSLIDTSSETGLTTHGNTFVNLTNISLQPNDHLPTKVCERCKMSLEQIARFDSICQTSDRRLTKLIKFSVKQDLTGEMVKEVVCQYTLFCQYFPEESSPSRPSTSYARNDAKTFSNKSITESSQCHIKVEKDLQGLLQNNDSDDDQCRNVPVTKSEADNVDLFLDSIEKLVSSKFNHERNKKAKKDRGIPKKSVRNLTCNICNKTLANRATYDYHMQRHGICRYICDQCGKGFPVLAELTQHQISQHGIGPYLECDLCSFKAPRRLELIEHIRLHTGERPFTCEKCGLTFRRQAIWSNHLKCHKEKTVDCNYCPRKFYRRSEMLAHSNNVHDRMYLYMCRVCNVTYAKTQTVRKHMLIKHGIPKETQGKIIKIRKNENVTLFKETNTGEQDYIDL